MGQQNDGTNDHSTDGNGDRKGNSNRSSDSMGNRNSDISGDVPVAGMVAPGLEAVREAFVENFRSDGEVGAAVQVIHHGRVVVDLWGGWRDGDRTDPWRQDTIVDMYSAGKAVLGVLVLRLVDSGVIGLDDPIASVWPEFAQGGKATATVRHILTHRAGVPAIRSAMTDEDLFDWDVMTAAIAATPAWFTPGERLAYHTNTYGHICGEIVHRASGSMPHDALAQIAEPLGADLFFGVPTSEQHRCADVIWAPPNPIFAPSDFSDFDGLEGDTLMNALAHLNPPGYSSIGVVNTSRWRSSQIGSTSGHGNASGLARFYAALLEPDGLVSGGLLAEASSIQVSEHCPILDDEFTYGLGFQPTVPHRQLGPNPHSYGHFGTGGALGFADPDAGIAFGYVMNHVIPRWQSSRNRRLINALYESLDESLDG